MGVVYYRRAVKGSGWLSGEEMIRQMERRAANHALFSSKTTRCSRPCLAAKKRAAPVEAAAICRGRRPGAYLPKLWLGSVCLERACGEVCVCVCVDWGGGGGGEKGESWG